MRAAAALLASFYAGLFAGICLAQPSPGELPLLTEVELPRATCANVSDAFPEAQRGALEFQHGQFGCTTCACAFRYCAIGGEEDFHWESTPLTRLTAETFCNVCAWTYFNCLNNTFAHAMVKAGYDPVETDMDTMPPRVFEACDFHHFRDTEPSYRQDFRELFTVAETYNCSQGRNLQEKVRSYTAYLRYRENSIGIKPALGQTPQNAYTPITMEASGKPSEWYTFSVLPFGRVSLRLQHVPMPQNAYDDRPEMDTRENIRNALTRFTSYIPSYIELFEPFGDPFYTAEVHITVRGAGSSSWGEVIYKAVKIHFDNKCVRWRKRCRRWIGPDTPEPFGKVLYPSIQDPGNPYRSLDTGRALSDYATHSYFDAPCNATSITRCFSEYNKCLMRSPGTAVDLCQCVHDYELCLPREDRIRKCTRDERRVVDFEIFKRLPQAKADFNCNALEYTYRIAVGNIMRWRHAEQVLPQLIDFAATKKHDRGFTDLTRFLFDEYRIYVTSLEVKDSFIGARVEADMRVKSACDCISQLEQNLVAACGPVDTSRTFPAYQQLAGVLVGAKEMSNCSAWSNAFKGTNFRAPPPPAPPPFPTPPPPSPPPPAVIRRHRRTLMQAGGACGDAQLQSIGSTYAECLYEKPAGELRGAYAQVRRDFVAPDYEASVKKIDKFKRVEAEVRFQAGLYRLGITSPPAPPAPPAPPRIHDTNADAMAVLPGALSGFFVMTLLAAIGMAYYRYRILKQAPPSSGAKEGSGEAELTTPPPSSGVGGLFASSAVPGEVRKNPAFSLASMNA